jgi:hypothetical protein
MRFTPAVASLPWSLEPHVGNHWSLSAIGNRRLKEMSRPSMWFLVLLMTGCWSNPSATALPRPFVEPGACPGEGCTYGVWQALMSVPVHESAESVPVSKSIREGQLVCSLTGDVHTMLGHFVVERQHGAYESGDTILVYTYRGEGRFLVEFDGVQFEEDLGFSPWGGTYGTRCEHEQCWGRLQAALDFTWWVQVDDLSGVAGWVQGAEGFNRRGPRSANPAFFAACDRRRRALE